MVGEDEIRVLYRPAWMFYRNSLAQSQEYDSEWLPRPQSHKLLRQLEGYPAASPGATDVQSPSAEVPAVKAHGFQFFKPVVGSSRRLLCHFGQNHQSRVCVKI